MQKPLIPLSLLRDLRCRHCQNFVTCGPVYVVPDESILCGRCRHLAKDIYRNISYEALASMFIYPCYNWEDNCSMTLLWNESLQHEEECSYNGCCKVFWNHPRAYFKGKRDIPCGDIRLTPVPEHLLQYIKCVLCESYLSCEPVYIQSNGKNVCHRCINANGIPPNCLRNLAYEKLSTIVIFPCIYRNRGCPTRLKFGRSLWQHEAECSYGQTTKKITNNPYKKEKGVIKTHSGHYYGTITPNVALFAPPSQQSEFEANKEVMKSLKKQQERRFTRADEIGMQFEVMNSEDGSICTEDSEGKDKSASASGSSSPTRLEADQKQKANNYPYQHPPVEAGFFSYNNKPPQPTSENYQQNLLIAQVHQEDYPTPKLSRSDSYTKSDYYRQHSNDDRLRKQSEESLSPKTSVSRKPLNSIDSNVLASHYPIFEYPKQSVPYPENMLQTPTFSSGLHSPTFNGGWSRFSFNDGHLLDHRVSRTDSTRSNRELIDELKVKLRKNNSMRQQAEGEVENAADSPYKECNNLEEILQAHDRIVQ